ncbi:hypothetical protein ADK60_37550 [Streptomyces sp. XY431]|uniref:hypothetical protein n=1 Tax=Streptomyces sp. XY431 TaxID=1415562 RepID=UPI0006AEBF5C|nr:hypothetical protein [Streptomyces sp. XY431]KOV10739.1 hypothetical protein ADK60_37550 [Streptomyces sp. XY431]
MTITVDKPVHPLPAARNPAPGAAAQAAAPAGAVHVVTRQEYEAAKAALAKLRKLGELITRSLMSIGAGALIFTCANVTIFAMKHDIPGWIAWMLDPMASLALITVLYVDGVLAEQGGDERAGTWPFLLRWFAGVSTWLMNSWTSLYPDGKFTLIPEHPDAGGLLLHSVAPFLLITMAEASSGYRKYLARRLGELRGTVQAFEDQQQAVKAERERRTREENERAERERQEAERAEREDRRLREEREHEQHLESERAREAAQIARIAAAAETERLREQAGLENARAQREAEKARAEREAEIERLREERELENARALREAERLRAERENEEARVRREQEIEAERLRFERENEEARARSEAEREALRIKAEGEAKAKVMLAEEQVRQQQAAEQERRAKEAAEAEDKRRKAEERAAARQHRLASQTARTSRSATSRVPSEIVSQNGGTVPREVRSQLREQAEREVARLMLEGSEIDQQAIGERYGKGETWVGDRVRTAKKRLADEDFALEVISSALEDEMPVSEETKQDDQAVDEAA